jgi:hypothetical protein
MEGGEMGKGSGIGRKTDNWLIEVGRKWRRGEEEEEWRLLMKLRRKRQIADWISGMEERPIQQFKFIFKGFGGQKAVRRRRRTSNGWEKWGKSLKWNICRGIKKEEEGKATTFFICHPLI